MTESHGDDASAPAPAAADPATVRPALAGPPVTLPVAGPPDTLPVAGPPVTLPVAAPPRWPYPVILAGCLVSALILVGCQLAAADWFLGLYQPTEAQRRVAEVEVRDYQRVHGYVDPGTARAEIRAAVAVFVGPPDPDPLDRIVAPGLDLRPPSGDRDLGDREIVGEGQGWGCRIGVTRWKTSRPLMAYHTLTPEQEAEFESGRLSVLSVSVTCPPR